MGKIVKRAAESSGKGPGQTTMEKQMELARTLLKTREAGFTRKAGRTRTMGLVWFAYLVMAVGFLMIGPISLAGGNGDGGVIEQIRILTIGYLVVLFAAPVALVLAGVSVFCAWRKHSRQLRTAILLALSIGVGLILSWLVYGYKIEIKPIDLAILMTGVVVAPILVKWIWAVVDNMMGRKAWEFRPNVILQAIGTAGAMVLLVGLEILAVQKVIGPVQQISEMYQDYKATESTLREMLKGSGSSGKAGILEGVRDSSGGLDGSDSGSGGGASGALQGMNLSEIVEKYLSGELDTGEMDASGVREILGGEAGN